MVLFREAMVDDIPRIQIVRREVRENRLPDPTLIGNKEVEINITERGKGWVAEIQGVIQGFAIAIPEEENIWALFVHPDAENQGIGTSLHKQMMDWYFEQGKKQVWLSTEPGSRAEKFYRLKGWRENGTTKYGEIRFEMTKEDWTNQRSE